MKKMLKKLGAIVIMAGLVVSSGVFGIKAQAAERPSNVTVSVSADSVKAGDTINITTYYTGDTATSIKFDFYSPYAAYDYNLNSYGYTNGSIPYYLGIGSFSATASSTASGATNTITVPSSVYGSYSVRATVTNASGSATGTSSIFVNNTTLDTAKPSVVSANVSVKKIGGKSYAELIVSATDDYARRGQTSSEVAYVQAAFENTSQPGTWTKTITLLPVPNTTGVYIGRLDISSIEVPGTYVLNNMVVADTSGNIAKYKKSGNTLQSSSSDERFFPKNLSKVTFSTGDAAVEETTDAANDNQPATEVTVTDSANANVSPKTSESSAMIATITVLAVIMGAGLAAVVLMADKASKVKADR